VLAVFTLDAASLSLIERLLAEGRMPALAGLRERGRWAPLETPARHFAAGLYQPLYSGEELSEHGLYFPYQWSAGEQRLRHVRAFPAPEPVWERVARAGGRSLVIDPYESRPPRVSGVTYLSGWQFVNRATLERVSVPRRLHRELSRRHGRPPVVEEVFGRPSLSRLLRMWRHFVAAPGRIADAATELLAREAHDLLWVSFPALHLGGHQLWDPSAVFAGAADPDLPPELREPLADVYAAADEALARTLAALPTGADVMVLSPVGMGANTSRSDLLPEMLEAVLADEPTSRRPQRGGYGSWIWRLRAGVRTGLRAGVARALPDRLLLDLAARLELRRVDWSRTRAFPLPTAHQGYVRLNLRGREREGIVTPGQADALMDEIAAGLLSFRDPDGANSVAGVDRVGQAIGEGPGLTVMPDLVVRWSERPATRLAGVSSPLHGEVRRRGGGTGRSGNHTEDAWVLLVPGASTLREPSRPPRLVDIAATACALLVADGERVVSGDPLLEPAPAPSTARMGG
jgi:predicted AlkP superfamily phosphohydrolase/phosphomutase